jgi:parallel beta-helix repeat protein
MRKMRKKKTYIALLLLFLLNLLTAQNIQLHASNSEIIVEEGKKIQEAIDAAKPGDTIIVKQGVFFEHLIINKSLKLIGEGYEGTVINGEGKGVAISITNTENVVIKGFRIENSALGILVENSWNVTIANNNLTLNSRGILLEEVNSSSMQGNVVKRNEYTAVTLEKSNNNEIRGNKIVHNTPYGIYLYDSQGNLVVENYVAYQCQGIRLENSSNNIITKNFLEKNSPYAISVINSYKNNITENSIINNNFGIFLEDSTENFLNANTVALQSRGIHLSKSTGNILRNNNLTRNWLYNFGVHGEEITHFVHDIDKTNTVEGKPIYYLVNVRNAEIPEDGGFVAIINSSRITVENLNLTKNLQGIVLAYSKEVIVRNSTINNNFDGIYFKFSNNCRIEGNTIKGNLLGVRLEKSINNIFFHNNFIDNEQHVEADSKSRNFWDFGYPLGGNFWGDYFGADVDRDGIGDTPYTLNAENIDNFPLLGKAYEFLAFENETTKQTVKIFSNINVSNFSFNAEKNTIEFTINDVDNETWGFCRVDIPKTLVKTPSISNWIVELNDSKLELNVLEDAEFTYLYFQFEVNGTVQSVQITVERETLDPILILLVVTIWGGTAVAFVIWKVKSKTSRQENIFE